MAPLHVFREVKDDMCHLSVRIYRTIQRFASFTMESQASSTGLTNHLTDLCIENSQDDSQLDGFIDDDYDQQNLVAAEQLTYAQSSVHKLLEFIVENMISTKKRKMAKECIRKWKEGEGMF